MSVERSAPARECVVVGVDGSESSRQALLWARFLAQATGSTVEAVAAYPWAGFDWAAAPSDWSPAENAHRLLADTLEAVFGDQPPPSLKTTVREGGAAKVLLEVADGAQMLVVGSRGLGGFSGLLLGSVSAACAEHATCPVLVVHGTTQPPSA